MYIIHIPSYRISREYVCVYNIRAVLQPGRARKCNWSEVETRGATAPRLANPRGKKGGVRRCADTELERKDERACSFSFLPSSAADCRVSPSNIAGRSRQPPTLVREREKEGRAHARVRATAAAAAGALRPAGRPINTRNYIYRSYRGGEGGGVRIFLERWDFFFGGWRGLGSPVGIYTSVVYV